MSMSKIVAMYSGGAASHVSCMRVKPDVLLFADTGEEHPSLYDAIEIGSRKLEVPLVKVGITGGMDSAIDKHKSIPSSKIPFCSMDLKIKPCFDWLEANAKGATIIIGYTWDEMVRVKRTQHRYAEKGYNAISPLTEKPYVSHQEAVEIYTKEIGVQPLYEQGFPHNNCGGACVKAGISQWKQLLKVDPKRFAKWKAREQKISTLHGKPCTILKRFGKPYPLLKLEEDVKANIELPFSEWGGCSCFTAEEMEEHE